MIKTNKHNILRPIIWLICLVTTANLSGQINTDQVMRVGQNSLYLEDYVLSIQYFNQVIAVKPYLAQPYFFRSIAKISLEDYLGAEEDASMAIERNPFITNAYEVRGVARQNMGKLQDAIKDYETALSQLPENRSILFNKALAEEELKDYDAAEKSYAILLKAHPKYDNGYIGRAKLRLSKGDTINALADIDTALKINKNATNAYVIRADISIKQSKDYTRALADMDEAIKLQPQFAGFFINRSFLRYNLDDYFGAMADLDYAIQLEPLNTTALFNRGLLRMEVNDNNKAIDDFDRIISLEPDNHRALYNRALLYQEIGEYQKSIDDIDKVIEAFPDFAGAYFLRSESRRLIGDRKNAEVDYKRSLAIADKATPVDESKAPEAPQDNIKDDESKENVANKFTQLLTIDNETDIIHEYNTSGIKGRVQDRNVAVEAEPMFTLSYYISTSEIKESPYYVKEIDDLNSTRILRFMVMLTNREPQLNDESEIAKHFESIQYYNSYLSTHTPRAIDYFGRAMDFYTLRDYKSAIADLDQAINLTPDFTLAYLLRANAKYKHAITERSNSETSNDATTRDMAVRNFKMTTSAVMADIDRVIELSPRMAFAHYNKGNILLEYGDMTSAVSAYNKAIELKSDFGEAYYNRGFIYLKLGNKDLGISDLSKAGELGIVPSYNLLKRMTR